MVSNPIIPISEMAQTCVPGTREEEDEGCGHMAASGKRGTAPPLVPLLDSLGTSSGGIAGVC
jgi:hypothetical protein